jgi:hypothetical protein
LVLPSGVEIKDDLELPVISVFDLKKWAAEEEAEEEAAAEAEAEGTVSASWEESAVSEDEDKTEE